jgi:hypothetical protein
MDSPTALWGSARRKFARFGHMSTRSSERNSRAKTRSTLAPNAGSDPPVAGCGRSRSMCLTLSLGPSPGGGFGPS